VIDDLPEMIGWMTGREGLLRGVANRFRTSAMPFSVGQSVPWRGRGCLRESATLTA